MCVSNGSSALVSGTLLLRDEDGSGTVRVPCSHAGGIASDAEHRICSRGDRDVKCNMDI